MLAFELLAFELGALAFSLVGFVMLWDTSPGRIRLTNSNLVHSPTACRYKEKMDRLQKLKEEKEQLQQR